jgi:hypothetical protein
MAEATTEKILGKFDTPDARDKALEEIHKKVMGDDAPAPTWADDDAKNKAYGAYERVLKTRKVEVEKKIETQPTIVKKPVGEDPLALGGGGEDDPDMDDVLARAGLQSADLEAQWMEQQRLKPEQYAALEKALNAERLPGTPRIGRKIIDSMIAGEFAKAMLNTQVRHEIRAKAVESVGGEQQFKNLEEWARANLANDLPGWNELIAKNPHQFPRIVKLMQAAHAEAVGAGHAKPLVTGGDSGGTASEPTTWSDVSQLVKKAEAGDAAARRILNRLDRTKVRD